MMDGKNKASHEDRETNRRQYLGNKTEAEGKQVKNLTKTKGRKIEQIRI